MDLYRGIGQVGALVLKAGRMCLYGALGTEVLWAEGMHDRIHHCPSRGLYGGVGLC